MEGKEREYTNEEITIVWKPELCIHSTICWKGLIEVFNPNERPWINPKGASSDRIVEQIKKCPTDALSYYDNKDSHCEASEKKDEGLIFEIVKDGPLMVHGDFSFKDKDGNQVSRKESTAFCRCGSSKNKPYCDGSHVDSNFKD